MRRSLGTRCWANSSGSDDEDDSCVSCAAKLLGPSRNNIVTFCKLEIKVHSDFQPYATIYQGVHPRSFVVSRDGSKVVLNSVMPSKTVVTNPSQHVAAPELKEERRLLQSVMVVRREAQQCETRPMCGGHGGSRVLHAPQHDA